MVKVSSPASVYVLPSWRVFPGIGVRHGLSFGAGAGGDGVVVAGDVVVVVVVPAVDVATGLLDPPGIGCGVVVVGGFVWCTFTHRCTRV